MITVFFSPKTFSLQGTKGPHGRKGPSLYFTSGSAAVPGEELTVVHILEAMNHVTHLSIDP